MGVTILFFGARSDRIWMILYNWGRYPAKVSLRTRGHAVVTTYQTQCNHTLSKSRFIIFIYSGDHSLPKEHHVVLKKI